ncbi:hypothetical protein NNO_1504 [Hydrogenimonas sp.]|nr:hypothetical protein NNO_1504 [Hydrogenimonas sp.]
MPKRDDKKIHTIMEIIEKITDHRRHKDSVIITEEDYKRIRKEVIDAMRIKYNLSEKDIHTIRTRYNDWFAELKKVNLIQNSDIERLDRIGPDDYEIYITRPAKKISSESAAAKMVARAAVLSDDETFHDEDLNIIWEKYDCEYRIPEEPQPAILRMLIPSVRRTMMRAYAKTVTHIFASWREEMEEAERAGRGKRAYDIAKKMKLFLEYMREYQEEIPEYREILGRRR